MKKGRIQNFLERIADEKQDLEMMQPIINDNTIEYAEWAAKCVVNLRRKATRREITVAKYLYGKRVIFISQCPFHVERRTYFADFYIPALKLVVELDGAGHKRRDSVYYDRERDWLLSTLGLTVLRIDNEDVDNGKFKEIISLPRSSLPRGRLST